MNNTIFFGRTTHPIGQGAFYSGNVEFEHFDFRYVYDCGSNNSNALSHEVERYITSSLTQDVLHALFISHFHRDHVRGLDELLAKIKVETAIIPYLSPFERLLLIAEKAASNNVNADEIAFLADPIAWLGDRNVDRVLVVTAGDDLSPPASDEFPVTNDDPQNRRGVHFDLKDLLGVARTDDTDSASQSGPTIYLLPHTTPLKLRDSNQNVLNWEFLTFVNSDPERTQKFFSELTSVFPEFTDEAMNSLSLSSELLWPILRSRQKRRELTDVYRRSFKDLNHTSLCLYSGPASNPTPEDSVVRLCNNYSITWDKNVVRYGGHSGSPLFLELRGRIGWLGTGDASLAITVRRQEFLQHFESRFQRCAAMTAPHHGSIDNFDVSLCQLGIPVFIATAKSKSRYHPNKSVVRSIQHSGAEFILVSEVPQSEIKEVGFLTNIFSD